MKRFILRYISGIVLVAFISMCVLGPSPILAQTSTGTLKIFSEVKGIEILIDEQSMGTDKAEIGNVQIGSHYVKAVKGGVTVYSELVTVTAGATTTILIKDTGQVKEKIMDSMYKQQQEYKAKKLDILLSKSYQTTGTSNTYSTYFPGYYYYYPMYGQDWVTRSSSTQTEITDWKIVQGGVEQISDVQFAALVGDKDALKKNAEAWDAYNNNIIIFGVIGITGIVVAIAGIAAPASDSSAMVAAVGIVAAVIGCGVVLAIKEPGGHLTTPGNAAKEAYQYNQKLKADLGLPENYEPQ